MRVEIGAAQVVKTAESDADRERLGREAEVLDGAAHPGLVHLLEVEPAGPGRAGRLVTARAGTPLAAATRQPPALLAGWLAAVATVLGDLHSVGWAHGAVTDEHILLDDHGRPVLCGLGSAVRLRDHADPAAATSADLAGLAGVLDAHLPAGREADRLRRRTERWRRPDGRSRRAGDAGALAAALLGAVAGARVGAPVEPWTVPTGETEEAPATSGRRPGRRRAAGMIVGAAVLAGAAAALVGVTAGSGHPAPRTGGARTVALSGAAGYSVVVPPAAGALTILGRWGCGTERPAVLYPADGQVWVFSAWPSPGRAVAGSPVGTVAGATGLAVVDRSPGCAQLEALRAPAAPVILPVGSKQ